MPASVPRFVRSTVVLAAIGTLTVAVLHHRDTSHHGIAVPAVPATPVVTRPAVWTQTLWGPLGPADRDLLVKVRQVVLCGWATGQRAQRHAASAQVRAIGARVTTEYNDLGNQVRSVAEKLGVPLPNQPNAQQQGWVRELTRLSGRTFDRTFAQRLRSVQSDVLPALVDETTSTRNDLIRTLATAAAVLVNRHMTYLERTGLISYPTPAPSHESHLNQVINITRVDTHPASGPEAMISPEIHLAALVSIIGLLYLLGNARPRTRWPSPRPGQPRHALRG